MPNTKRIHAGDHVQFTSGNTSVRAIVVGDRGPIGANKNRILQIRVPDAPYEDEVFEMSEDQLTVIDQETSRGSPIRVDESREYFANGGLVQILRAAAEGRTAAWLCRNSLGNLTHTFSPDRGIVGGAIIPTNALHGHYIFRPKRDEVLDYLSTFGLSRTDAEQVIRSVGLVPKHVNSAAR